MAQERNNGRRNGGEPRPADRPGADDEATGGERGGGEQRGASQGEEERTAPPESDQPRPHGDALREGTGSRHGVRETERRPDTCG